MSNAFLRLAVVGCADGSKDKNTYLFYISISVLLYFGARQNSFTNGLCMIMPQLQVTRNLLAGKHIEAAPISKLIRSDMGQIIQ